MSSVVYSPLCDKNPSLYLAYLFSAACNGECVKFDSEKCGGRAPEADSYSRVDAGRSVAFAYRDFCRVAEVECERLDQGSLSSGCGVIASTCYNASVVRGAREIVGIPNSVVVDDGGCVVGSDRHDRNEGKSEDVRSFAQDGLLNDNSRDVSGDETINITSFARKDGITMASDVTSVHTVGARGPNYARNRKNREKKKLAKRLAGCSTAKVVPDVSEPLKTIDENVHSSGFWSSCSPKVRQELIDSKARMHIADNNRKAEESERRVKQLQSPEQLLRDALRMFDFANAQAKKQNESKVYGWAKTVAESYAETIAKSVPTSVESFESFVQSNSSITSVSLDVFNDLLKEKEKLEKELQKVKGKAGQKKPLPNKSSGVKEKKFDLCAGTLKDGKVVKSAKLEDRLQDIIDAGMAGSSQFAGVDFGRYSCGDEEYFG